MYVIYVMLDVPSTHRLFIPPPFLCFCIFPHKWSDHWYPSVVLSRAPGMVSPPLCVCKRQSYLTLSITEASSPSHYISNVTSLLSDTHYTEKFLTGLWLYEGKENGFSCFYMIVFVMIFSKLWFHGIVICGWMTIKSMVFTSPSCHLTCPHSSTNFPSLPLLLSSSVTVQCHF